jgi:hypothetical protein
LLGEEVGRGVPRMELRLGAVRERARVEVGDLCSCAVCNGARMGSPTYRRGLETE